MLIWSIQENKSHVDKIKLIKWRWSDQCNEKTCLSNQIEQMKLSESNQTNLAGKIRLVKEHSSIASDKMMSCSHFEGKGWESWNIEQILLQNTWNYQ